MSSEEGRYKNPTGLVLYSGNPFVISRIAEICSFIKGDKLRKEILHVKMVYSAMSETQQEVYKRIGLGKFQVYKHMNKDFRAHLGTSNKSTDSSFTWVASDIENGVVFECSYKQILVSSTLGTDDYDPKVLFSDDPNICKLFCFMCECFIDKENNSGKISQTVAKWELNNMLLSVYGRKSIVQDNDL